MLPLLVTESLSIGKVLLQNSKPPYRKAGGKFTEQYFIYSIGQAVERKY